MEKLKRFILPVGLIIVLLLPIVIEYVNKHKLEVKSYDSFKEEMNNSEFSLVYFGDTKNEDYGKIKDNLINLKSKYDISAYSVSTEKLSGEEIESLIAENEKFEKGSVYAFVKDGRIIKVVNVDEENVDIDAQVNKYVNNVIPEDEIAYKTVKTYKEFNAIFKSKNITMHVFGRNSCYYCNIFKPVYNEVASEYSLDIYYYDSDSFDSTEYSKILNSGIKIPAECSSTGEEKPLSEGFGTPLTLFSKKGEVVGCLSGYVDKTKLIDKITSKKIGINK